VDGATGRGCAVCDQGYFQAGGDCISCPAASQQAMLALVGLGLIGGLVALIWHVTSIHMEIKGRDEVEGAEDKVEDKVSSAKQAREDFARVSKNALTMSILLPSCFFQAFTYTLPFGWPSFLVGLGEWAVALLSVDVGQVGSPECSGALSDASATTKFVTKLALTQAGFWVVIGLLKLVSAGSESRKRHGANARTATYLFALPALLRSSFRCLDCTSTGGQSFSTFMPEVECWSGDHAPLILYALLNFIIFVIAVPFYLYTKLSSAGEAGRQKKAFAEAHGWITLRYK